MSFLSGRHALCAAMLVLVATPAQTVETSHPIIPSLPVAQILQKMEEHDRNQKENLRHYQAVRHYQVDYHGFGTSLAAKMDVEATYDASSGKSFRFLTQSGSKILCEKVIKRAVDSEKEASLDPKATALTNANYKFQFLGTETLNDRPAYILSVEPLKESKFLYRGKIWVDATDFAVVKVEAGPAKNPSFWISRTLIRYSSAKTGDFWLPRQNRSETKVRIGGSAVLTIDYGTYQIVSNPARHNAGD
jgi:hypothetical protein